MYRHGSRNRRSKYKRARISYNKNGNKGKKKKLNDENVIGLMTLS